MKVQRVLKLVNRKCHLKYKISFSNKTLTSNFSLYKNHKKSFDAWGGGHARYHITLELLSTIKAELSHKQIISSVNVSCWGIQHLYFLAPYSWLTEVTEYSLICSKVFITIIKKFVQNYGLVKKIYFQCPSRFFLLFI